MLQNFIFGGNAAAQSPEELQRRRAILDQLRAQGPGPTRNIGEGLSEIGRAIGGRIAETRLRRKEDEARAKVTGQLNDYLARRSGRAPSTFSSAPSTFSGPVGTPMFPDAPASEPASAPAPVDIAGTVPPDLGGPAMEPTPGGAPAQPTPAYQDDPAGYVVQGLVQRGLPQHVAEGFAMNFGDESGFDPGINERNPIVAGSRGGFGLSQWTGPRRRQLEAFAAQRGAPVSDVDTQLDFLMTELQGPEARAANAIMSTRDAGGAAAAIVNQFLRPAEEHRARREAKYLGGAAVPSGPASFGGGGGGAPSFSMEDLQELAAMAGNPYLPEGQRALVQALMQQQLGAMDPNTALDLQIKQAELAELQQPEQPDLPSSVQEYQFARQSGFEGSYQDFLAVKKDGTNISVNTGQPVAEIGTIPQGWEYVIDPETGQRTARPVAGGPAAVEAAAAADKAARQGDLATTASDVTTDAASRAAAADRSRAITGIAGRLMAHLPGTDNAEVVRQVDVLKSQTAAGNLNAMRQASPTGGALGNVTEKELKLLQDMSGALDPASPNFQRDLADYTRTLLRTVHGVEEGDRQFTRWRAEQSEGAAPDAQDAVPEGLEAGDLQWLGMQ